MLRRLLKMLPVVVVSLAIAGPALAKGPAGPVAASPSVATNYRAMPCLCALKPFAGEITTAQSIDSSSRGIDNGHSLRAHLQAGVLFVYQPTDTSLPSFIGVAQVNQDFDVDSGTASVDFPLTIPVLGSDGSTSSVETTATAVFNPAAHGNRVSVDMVLGDFSCDGVASPSAKPTLAPNVSSSLASVIADATDPNAAALITNMAATTSGSSLKTLFSILASPSLLTSPLAAPMLQGVDLVLQNA